MEVGANPSESVPLFRQWSGCDDGVLAAAVTGKDEVRRAQAKRIFREAGPLGAHRLFCEILQVYEEESLSELLRFLRELEPITQLSTATQLKRHLPREYRPMLKGWVVAEPPLEESEGQQSQDDSDDSDNSDNSHNDEEDEPDVRTMSLIQI